MPDHHDSLADRAWQWVLKIAGLSVFLYAAREGSDTSYAIAFMGIILAVFPLGEVRSIIRSWRRAEGQPGGDGKATP